MLLFDESYSYFVSLLLLQQNNSAPDMKSISSAQSPTPDRSDAASSISSRTSSPDSQRRDSRTSLNSAKSGSGSNGSFHTPQTNFLQKQKELREQELQVDNERRRWALLVPICGLESVGTNLIALSRFSINVYLPANSSIAICLHQHHQGQPCRKCLD